MRKKKYEIWHSESFYGGGVKYMGYENKKTTSIYDSAIRPTVYKAVQSQRCNRHTNYQLANIYATRKPYLYNQQTTSTRVALVMLKNPPLHDETS